MADFVDNEDIEEEIDLDDNDPNPQDEVEQVGEGGEVEETVADSTGESDPLPDDGQDMDEDDNNLSTPFMLFDQHKQPVLSVAIASNGDFVVSGGQDDIGHVWDPLTGSVKFSTTGHSDSVHCVAINRTNAFIATADMSGLIQVWKSSNGEKVFDYEVDDIHWIEWHPMAASVILVGTDSGAVWMFNVSDHSRIKTFQGPSTAMSIGKITSDGTKMLVGYDDGSLRLWDLKSAQIIHTFKDSQGHSSNVTCIDFKVSESSSNEPVIISASGNTDGSCLVINLSTGKQIIKIECGQISNSPNEGKDDEDMDDKSEDGKSVESISFCSSLPLLMTSTVSGVVEVWETTSGFTKRRFFFTTEADGLSKCRWHPTMTHRLVASGLDGVMYVWDARNGSIVDKSSCHRDQILDFDCVAVEVDMTSDQNGGHTGGEQAEKHVMLVTASEDSTCRVFCV